MTDPYEKRNRVYKSYQSWLVNALNESIDATITGSKQDQRLGLFSQFHLLVQLRNEDYASCRPLTTDIECMHEALFCRGVDTRIMEDVFPPSYDDSDGSEYDDGSGSGSVLDGIDNMQITPVDSPNPVNRII